MLAKMKPYANMCMIVKYSEFLAERQSCSYPYASRTQRKVRMPGIRLRLHRYHPVILQALG